jgi:hypothetical protein
MFLASQTHVHVLVVPLQTPLEHWPPEVHGWPLVQRTHVFVLPVVQQPVQHAELVPPLVPLQVTELCPVAMHDPAAAATGTATE